MSFLFTLAFASVGVPRSLAEAADVGLFLAPVRREKPTEHNNKAHRNEFILFSDERKHKMRSNTLSEWEWPMRSLLFFPVSAAALALPPCRLLPPFYLFIWRV